MSTRRRWIGTAIGFVLVLGGFAVAFVTFAPCAFATSEPSFDSVIASTKAWLEVEPPFPPGPNTDDTVVLALSVRDVGPGSRGGEPRTERIRIHGSFLGDIRSALEKGSRVFLAFSSQGSSRGEVSFVVARTPGGAHNFLGGCAWGPGSRWMRDELGSRFDPAMRRVVGLTDADAIYRALAYVVDAPDHVLVTYGEPPADLRMFTRTGKLVERGSCLAIQTDVGPLVPIWDRDSYYLAVDEEGLVVMSGLDRAFKPGDRLMLAGREMSPTEALAVTSRNSIRACPGRLILVSSASRTTAA